MLNKDFGKKASDLLTKDFPDNFELEISSDGSCVSVSANVEKDNDGNITESVNPTFTINDKTDLETTLSSDGSQVMKLVMKDFLTKNLKSSVAIDSVAKRDEAGSVTNINKLVLTDDYTFEKGSVSAKFVFPSLGLVAPKVTAGGVFVKDKFAVGAEGVFDIGSDNVFEKGTLNLQYTQPKYTASVGVTTSGGNVALGGKYYYEHPNYLFAAAANFKDEFSAEVAVGKSLKDGAFVKAALRTCGTVGLSYKKQVCENSSMVVGSEIDINSWTHRFGMSFECDL